MFLKRLFTNIQFNQTFILSIILFVGVYFYKLDISFIEIFIIFTTVILLDFLFLNKLNFNNLIDRIKNKNIDFPYSGVNAGFGISFFLRTEDIILYIVAGFIAIGTKYLLKSDGKHFLNPSNIGVVAILVLFPQYSWVNTLQWGNYTGIITYEYLIAFFIILLFGIFISLRVYKFFNFKYLFDYILPFLFFHFLLFFIIPYSETLASFFVFFSVSFFIFTFFMITDPKTVPLKSSSRFIYSLIIVLNFYILQFFINENYSIIASLTFATFLLPIIWKSEEGKYTKNIFNNTKILLSLIFVFLSIILYTLIVVHGQPDLAFNNTCNQLFCM